ncbi:MAG: homocysteine S-methyltransferase family protein [Candidatus Zixiibacteriota bacterium]|nr:MAG: homocysteine S-methyltransferase family protein [candidate division Zixibacteria bacterium]
MPDLLERIKGGETLVADGAMGTMLFARGLKPGDCPESVNLKQPQLLEEIAAAYVRAGSDIISTNTFGASPLKLDCYGLANKTDEINAAAVRAARKAAGTSVYVAASVGPCGRLIQPYGDIPPGQVAASFERQLKALVAEGIDAVFIETMTDLTEAALAIDAARAVAPSLPVSATMTFDHTPKGFFTIMGVSVQQAAGGLARAGADIIGSNCGNGIDNMVHLAEQFAAHTDLPMIIQSNAGLPEIRDGLPIYSESPAYMAERVDDLLRAGVSIVGGCCGTTPDHIASIRKRVDSGRYR